MVSRFGGMVTFSKVNKCDRCGVELKKGEGRRYDEHPVDGWRKHPEGPMYFHRRCAPAEGSKGL